MSDNTLQHVPLAQIRDNPAALRAVNRDSEDYHGLVDSVKARGILNAISLREKADASGVAYYELIDGLHRLSAARDAGLTSIPAQILSLNDAEVLEAQIIGNIQRIETKPVEYSAQLLRMLGANPMMTEAELSVKLGKSPTWTQQRLGLTKISNPTIKAAIDEGSVNLSNAYALARLPDSEQLDFFERAQTEEPAVFVGAVNARIKDIKEAKRQGREAAPAEYVATAHLQKMGDLKAVLEDPNIVRELLSQMPVDTKEDAFILAIKWALHLDDLSIEAGQAKWQAQQDAKKAANDRRKAERAAKAAELAAAKAAEAAEAVEE